MPHLTYSFRRWSFSVDYAAAAATTGAGDKQKLVDKNEQYNTKFEEKMPNQTKLQTIRK